MTKSKYTCAQVELYTIAKLGWQSCKANLTKFTQFKGKYTAQFITDRINEVTDASMMLDEQARKELTSSLHVKLETQGEKCLNSWQRLKRYIVDAYPEDILEIKLDAAGSNYYPKASKNNWDFVKGLMQSGSTFIDNHSTELLANLNMPAGFETSFNALKQNFEILHQDFLKSEENTPLQTEAKLVANNEIYGKLINMFLDAQEIFKGNDTLLKQFIFSEVLYLVSGAGTAGIKGKVLLAESFNSLVGVKVSIPEKNKSVLTDDEGKYELPIGSGIYTIQFYLEGYKLFVVENYEVKVGTMSKVDCSLEPM